MKEKRIGIDIDDTLLDFVSPYLSYHNEIYNTNFKKETFETYSFNLNMGGTMAEVIDGVHNFYKTSFFKEIQPFPNSVEIIDAFKQKDYELFIITSRPDFIIDETKKWIDNHFPNKFSDIFFSYNHYTRRKNNGKTKAEICNDLGVSVLIDDSLEYGLQCANKGINVLLLDSPWNRNGEHKRIIRVKNWEEIRRELR